MTTVAIILSYIGAGLLVSLVATWVDDHDDLFIAGISFVFWPVALVVLVVIGIAVAVTYVVEGLRR